MKINSDLVKKLRSDKHWSQEQLGDACSLNLRTIQRLENSGNASLESVRALASVFGVDPDTLIVVHKNENITPWDVVKTCFIKYADFSGTATRFEYWWFFLFVLLLACLAFIINNKLYQVFHLIIVVPLLAAGTRRLNDAGESGWWQLMFLVPFGFVVPVYMLALKGKVDTA